MLLACIEVGDFLKTIFYSSVNEGQLQQADVGFRQLCDRKWAGMTVLLFIWHIGVFHF